MRWTAAALAVTLAAAGGSIAWAAVDLSGRDSDPFSASASVRVLLFVRTDCPLTNRYAPELKRLAGGFAPQGVRFWLVYSSSAAEPADGIKRQIAEYQLPGEPLRDTNGRLAARARATVAPEAAVFDRKGRLTYHGRIDDQWVALGKARPSAHTHDLEAAIADTLVGRRIEHAETRAVGCSLADLAGTENNQ